MPGDNMASLITSPKMQFFDANGNPLVGGKLYTYTAGGTSTPQATYTDSTGGTPNANPVILNARGEASVWGGSSLYYMVLKDSTDVQVWTADNVGSVATLAALAASGGSALVGFIQAGTGAVATTALAKQRETISVKDFGDDLTVAVSAIGSDERTLVVSSPVALSANLTIPANITLHIRKPGLITITGSKTLTINGPFNADSYQVFSTPTCVKGSGTGPVLATITNNVVFTGSRKPIVNPRWFGAGGTSDDWAALQSALWCVTSAAPGISVQLESGVTYTTGKSLVIDTTNFRLLPAPGAIIRRANGVANETMNVIDIGHEGRYTWSPSMDLTISIEGVEFDGNKANNPIGAATDDTYDNVLSLLYMKGATINQNIVRNASRFGIAVSNSDDVEVLGNRVYNCDENGIYGESGVNLNFIGNTVSGCNTVAFAGEGAVSMSNVVGGAIVGNTLVDGYNGIFLRNICNGVAISANAIKSPLNYGIWLKDPTDAYTSIPTNITISGNSVVLSGSTCCFLELARKVSVTGNTFDTNGSAYNIHFRNGEDQTFSGNVLTGAITTPFYDASGNSRTFASDVSGSWTPVITGSTAAGAGTYTVQSGRYTREGNRIRISGTITQTAHTGTGQLRISLPFSSTATEASLLTSTIYNTAITGHLDSVVVGGQAYARCSQNNGGTLTDFAVVAGAATIYFSGEYEV